MLAQINSTLLGYKKMDHPLPSHLRHPKSYFASPIMPSLDPSDSPLESLSLTDDAPERSESVHLLDDQERLLVASEQHFMQLLEIGANSKIKVVSIFGNTGEGKSYTLNHTFFDGREVFRTSPAQNSCTIGVWAKFDPVRNTLCLDTEGLLGISKKEHQRTRLLLKILAVSDVIIYRTKAERLPRDLYTFLGGASKAYKEHFDAALKKVFQKYDIDKPPGFGPCLIIFHETRYTDTLKADSTVNKSPEDIVRENFHSLNEPFDGFSGIKYIGLRQPRGKAAFLELKVAVEKELESTHVRSARDAKYIFMTLKGLNEQFHRQITDIPPQLYLPAFFTCQDKCLSCGAGCALSMGHKDEETPHSNTTKQCVLQHQYQNFVYVCRKCKLSGHRRIVEPSYQTKTEQFWSSILSTVWSGYVIECPKCGKIYQSREYWYGNKDPKDEAVEIEIVHVWPGDKHYFQEKSLLGSNNSAQKMLDGVTSISNVVASVGSQPTKMISDWVTDQIAPSYWRPNHEIKNCFRCHVPLSNAGKHHCRACGEGFCERCSAKTQPVPARGWREPVRVCDDCYREEPPSMSHLSDSVEVRTRMISESVLNSFSMVKSVLDIPKEMIKETARPTYWTPDNECTHCAVCSSEFEPLLKLHHCRDCGKGVCDECSKSRKPVPLRGWETPVRICDNCSSS